MTKENVNESNSKKEDVKEWFEIAVTLTVSFCMLGASLSFYWTSPFILKIVEDKENYNITEEQASLFAVFNSVFLIILPPLLVPIIDNIGRKKTLLLSSIPYIILWSIKAFSTNLWLLYLARAIAGVGDAIVFAQSFAYVSEVTSPRVRGLWGNALMCFAYVGQFLINVLGIHFNVATTSYICITVPILFSAIFMFMPESPYYHLSKGDFESAKKSLITFRRRQNVNDELDRIQRAVNEKQTNTSTWKDLITVENNRKALFVAILLRISQSLSGVFVFGSYTQFIFKKIGSSISAETSTLIYTASCFVLYSFGAFVSSKLGRRKSMLFSLVSCAVVISLEALYFYTETHSLINLSQIQWFPLAGLLLFLVFSCVGVGILPPLITSEIFSPSISSKGMALVTTFLGIAILISNNIFYYLNSYTGLWGPFLLFGGCNLLSGIIFFFILPETKDKTLEEIQQFLINGKSQINGE